jgi:hypothetical protein
MPDDSPTITQQYSFAVGEDGETDEAIEPAEETVETDLETWGAEVDHRERDTRIEQPEASSFGVDDRKTVTRGDGGEQHALFADTEDDQQTLTGERAASQCLFENDEHDGDDRADESTTDEPSTENASDETPRAVATDGGRVEDDTDASEKVMMTVPRKDLAGVADALDAERETIERNAGEGPKTETLARLVEECRLGLSLFGINDETATISRTTAAAAADELQAAAKTEAGDYAEELQRLAAVLRRTLDKQPSAEDDEQADADSDGGHGFAVGARVMDRDADDPNPAVVVALPDEPAYAREIDALDGQSVADVNPEYGASGPVATVAYVDDLETAFDVWREADPDALGQICADEDVRTYDFPTARLQEATKSDGGREHDPDADRDGDEDADRDTGTASESEQDETFDPDAETVTDAWEGAYIQASWGYDQTNVELAQIVEVSGSGKTVVARMVVAERVGHGRTSEQLRPTANQYGDGFRLHVRNGINDDPKFRGTYPLSNDGDMDDGPTRRGWFYPFDNDPENSVRRTATNHGH